MAVTIDRQAGIIRMTAANDVTPTGETFTPMYYRYRGATMAGHTAQLADLAGAHVLFDAEAGNANLPDIQPVKKGRPPINGFKLIQISSGVVEIHLK